MNPTFLGDLYDLVKRFFILELQSLGYAVAIDPMFTGDWAGQEDNFHRLLGLGNPANSELAPSRRSLFIDPDTGLNERGGRRHVSFHRIEHEVQSYELVFAFDQSFSRRASPIEVMKRKMSTLSKSGVRTMYYDSHARFLFASSREEVLREVMNHVVLVGMPRSRFIAGDA
jgi:hypothetical protein